MSFSEKLRSLLESREMRAIDLANATGLSGAAISDYLNGKKEPRGKQSVEIAKALNVSLDELWETEFAENKFLSVDEYNLTDGNLSFGEKIKEAKKNRGYTKRAPASEESETEAERIIDLFYTFLVEAGYVVEGDNLTSRQMDYTVAILNLVDLSFGDEQNRASAG